MRDGRIFEHRFTLPSLLGNGDRLIHQLLDARALKRGNGDDGQSDLLLQKLGVDDVARLFHRVHHVERDDDGDVDLHELGGQIEVALEVGCIDDVDDARRLFIEDEVARDDLFGRIGRERIDAGQVDDLHGLLAALVCTHFFVHRDARPVADVRRGSGEEVKERRLAAVGISSQSKLFHFLTSSVTHAASDLRSVSS